MYKILITDAVDNKCKTILESSGFEVTFEAGMPTEKIKSIIKDYNALIVRSETQVNSDVILLMDKMIVIGRAGTGVDNIDVDSATRKGIIVMNTPGGNTVSTAEHTMALMLGMCRNIAQANISLREGKWERKKFKGTELEGKNLGVFGLGKVGKEVALRGRAFGMNILGYDPVLSSESASKLGLKFVSPDQLFSESDIISVHVPLTTETENLISESTLEKCKTGVKIINCARGGIVNENDLLKALNNGKVSAAAFDVFIKEPPDYSSELIQHPKVLTTPHLGASTEEAQEKVAVQIAEQVSDLLKNKSVRGVMNAASIEVLQNEEFKPYIILAEKLGNFIAQISNDQLRKLSINLSGRYLHSFSEILNKAVLKGFLSNKIDEPVNFINVNVLAEEREIVFDEIKTNENLNYQNLIKVDFIGIGEKRSVSGTVFGKNEIRIVMIDEYRLELKPEGNLLIYKNIDKPGMLAAVSKVLAEEKINIAGLSLGRTESGNEALTVINIDGEINTDVVSRINSTNGIWNLLMVKI
jgi:D-3-phosphoglycerate dehydrogenase / 2-oxoglutarate reductase